MVNFQLSIKRWPIHFRHAEVAKHWVVDMGTDSLECFFPVRRSIDRAGSLSLYVIGHQLPENRIVVNHEHPWTFEASHVNIAIWPPVSWFILNESLAAGRTDGIHT
jgi:hypothetical protein